MLINTIWGYISNVIAIVIELFSLEFIFKFKQKRFFYGILKNKQRRNDNEHKQSVRKFKI